MIYSLVLFIFPLAVFSRIHHLSIQNDGRRYIQLSSFGFLSGGKLTVNMTGFHLGGVSSLGTVVGFSIEKTDSDALNPYIRAKETQCILEKVLPTNNDGGIVKMIMNFTDEKLNVECSKNIQSVVILDSRAQRKINESCSVVAVAEGAEDEKSLESEDKIGASISKREKPTNEVIDSHKKMKGKGEKNENEVEDVGEDDGRPSESINESGASAFKSVEKPNDEAVKRDKKIEGEENESKGVEDGESLEIKQLIDDVIKSDKNMERDKENESKVLQDDEDEGKSLESANESGTSFNESDEMGNSDNKLSETDKTKLVAGDHKATSTKSVESNIIPKPASCKDSKISLNIDSLGNFETSFVVYLSNESMEGLYSIFFHNCENYRRERGDRNPVYFTIDIDEKNSASYLSAGDMPLPALYQAFSILFFIAACFWSLVLANNSTSRVYRIHWLMSALIFLKSLSLFFHGADYKEIAANGVHTETWAVLYYITHLLKGGLLFFTIVLIGSGWAFVKHVLSNKEKKVFMVVLPLQVVSNVAYIILEESEQGEATHKFWKEVFVLIDLICCCAILLPVIWSIRHLQEASASDGKAASSLEKLKLFKHFYLMVVCYVYFTRIIVYMLRISLPFQYVWLESLFTELATLMFFVMTGYKFRPAASNPYFTVADSDDEEILIGGSATVGQVKSRKGYKGRDYRDEEESVGLIGNSEKYSCEMSWINDYKDKDELFVPVVDANDISDDNLNWIDEYEDVEEVEGVHCAVTDK